MSVDVTVGVPPYPVGWIYLGTCHCASDRSVGAMLFWVISASQCVRRSMTRSRALRFESTYELSVALPRTSPTCLGIVRAASERCWLCGGGSFVVIGAYYTKLLSEYSLGVELMVFAHLCRELYNAAWLRSIVSNDMRYFVCAR